MLQRWLNVFNLRGRLYPDMDADGRIGPRTHQCIARIPE
ncbi:hypothetical protein O5699_04075 [Escherichia coli]|nr:hypothetical protein [Escherichia coli]